MKRIQRVHQAICLIIVVVLSVSALGCSTAEPQTPRLRITNGGTTDIENLTVLFPEDEIMFGDVPAGTTTEYEYVPNGVYRYAAYRFELEGQTVTQPVIDWVGEEPIESDSFTYTLDFDPNRPPVQMVQLVDVTQDD